MAVINHTECIPYQVVESNYDEDGSEGAADAVAVHRTVRVHLGGGQVREVHKWDDKRAAVM